ncbi:crosslink repair DNA glycosylase YcaQ family protein [Microbacterium sp. AZCO]|uniref:DNA glycosylase AlkZ-like family protein n=1 Tax=Microbacterium sp. AZCO TaxID=3142976 RepID=UPI0031F354F2
MRTLTRDEARRIIVRAQLLDADRPGDVVEVAEQLGYIKIDPTATIAPCEHTVAWSRIGWSYEPGQLQKAVEIDRLLFEFDGTFRPMSILPLMRPSMRRHPRHERSRQWLEANTRFRADVLARLAGEGPLLASQIPDTAQVARDTESGWYGSNQVPQMLEMLARRGEIAVLRREGRHRVWDLAERVWPTDLPEYDDAEAERLLHERRLQSAGIAKQKSPWTPVGEAGEPISVEGSRAKWRVDPEALAALDDDSADGRVAFLNPYDSLLFDRPRLEEVFEFTYVLEQFKPKAQRVYGYFAHPILIGDRFVGMLDAEVDKARENLRVTAVHEFLPFEPEEHEMVRAEIAELGEWLGMPVVGSA